MAELWAKIEFNPIDFINPTKILGVKICDLMWCNLASKDAPKQNSGHYNNR